MLALEACKEFKATHLGVFERHWQLRCSSRAICGSCEGALLVSNKPYFENSTSK